MGILKSAAGSVGGVMADQWLEIYSCEGMPNDTLAVRGEKKTGANSANTKGEDNVISDGSTIIVHDGQCAIAIDRGQVIGFFDQPGENTFRSDRTKSVFGRGGLKSAAKQSWERFGYGGVAAIYQVVMYLDLKEHHSNPFRVTRAVNIKDRHSLTEMDINVTLKGMFSFRITEPLTFYKNICGNSTGTVKVEMVLPQMQTELASALGEALSKLGAQGAISPTDISSQTGDIAAAVGEVMTAEWSALRGFSVTALSVSEVNIADADKRLLQGLERDKVFTDPTMAAAHIAGAQGDAMRTAAGNPAGGGVGFVAAMRSNSGTNMFLKKDAPPAAQNMAPAAWRCACGSVNTSRFCSECGQKKPE